MYGYYMFMNMIPKMAKGNTTLAQFGSSIASLLFVLAIIQRYIPHDTRNWFGKYTRRFMAPFYPYIEIKFHEFNSDRFKRSDSYSTIESYLRSTTTKEAKRLKGSFVKNKDQNQIVSLSMDDYEEVADIYKDVKVYWTSGKRTVVSSTTRYSVSSFDHPSGDERRYYKISFHKRYRELIIGDYLKHVYKKGKEIRRKNRSKKLYTNNGSHWTQVVFEHPSTFQTLAMDPDKKQEIIDDLTTFSKAEEYYARIGKAWKRGYLLFGPPGTGKSTMIAAMANFLEYHIYDLELTAVSDNTALRKLLIETSSKSIIVIEDIDCSVDLTSHRKKNETEEEEEEKGSGKKMTKSGDKNGSNASTKVTLSGLLNFIDGLWSACGGERLIVFTTNFVDKLDPALIRRGRMDKHIEMGYCSFEAFKVLAKNYLYLESHELFDEIRVILEETDMTPADVAENLMPKTSPGDPEMSLKNLIGALKAVKLKKVAEEEEKKKGSEVKKIAKNVEKKSSDEECKVLKDGAANGSSDKPEKCEADEVRQTRDKVGSLVTSLSGMVCYGTV